MLAGFGTASYQLDTFDSAFRLLAACYRAATLRRIRLSMILRLKRRIPEIESATAPRNPWILGRVNDLRAADAAKPNHKGIRNGHGVNSGELIGTASAVQSSGLRCKSWN